MLFIFARTGKSDDCDRLSNIAVGCCDVTSPGVSDRSGLPTSARYAKPAAIRDGDETSMA
jgi:hypothetical protein